MQVASKVVSVSPFLRWGQRVSSAISKNLKGWFGNKKINLNPKNYLFFSFTIV